MPSDDSEILKAYLIIRRIFPAKIPCLIMQVDNYVFRQQGFEIKLANHKGKTDKFNFEVEILNEAEDLALLLESLGLAGLVTITDVTFWNKWNREINLTDIDLNEAQLVDLIRKYL